MLFHLDPCKMFRKKSAEYELSSIEETKYKLVGYLTNSGIITSAEEKTAAQLVVWEITADWNNNMLFDFTEGNFSIRDLGWLNPTQTVLQGVITGYNTFDSTAYLLAFPLVHVTYPSYVLQYPTTLPATGVLLATGIAFLHLVLRNRKTVSNIKQSV